MATSTTTRELTLKFSHVNGDSTSLKFGNISVAGAQTLKAKIRAINSGTINVDGMDRTVNYQSYLLSKAGSPAVKIDSASYTATTTNRVYTQGQEE